VNPLGVVVRHAVPCAPCFSEETCPNASRACIRGITVDAVMHEVEKVLLRSENARRTEACSIQ
jgi:hypothetical protein